MTKNILKASVLIFVLILLLIFPAPIISATKTGLLTWGEKVVPSLFPFFVLTRLMIHYQVPQLIGKLLAPIFKHLLHISPLTFFIMLMSLISGNPTGPKMAHDYYNQQQISKREFQGLLYFCSFASPLFIIGTIGVIFFESSTVGYFLFLCHILGSLVVFICCYPYFKNTDVATKVEIQFPTQPFSIILIDSIETSLQTLIRVGGIIMFFFIVAQALSVVQIVDFLDYVAKPILTHLNITTLEPLLSGMLEFTQGVAKVSSMDLPFHFQLAISAFIVSFGGLSVHTQTLMFASNADFSYGKYALMRLFHGWASTLLVLFSWRFFFNDQLDVFAPIDGINHQTSLPLVGITLGIIIFYLFMQVAKRVKHLSGTKLKSFPRQ